MPKKAKSAYAPQPLIKRTNGCVKFTISARKHSEIHPCKKTLKICKILKNYFYSTPLNLKKIKSTRLFKDVYTELKIYGFQQNTKITFEIFSSPHLNNLFEHSRIFNLIPDTLNLRMWLHPSLHKWNRPDPKGYKPVLFNIHNNVLMLYFLPVPKDQS